MSPRSRRAATRARLVLLAVETELKGLTLGARRGELVDAQVIDRKLFEFGRRHRDAFLNWPVRVSAELAATLGVDEAAVLLQLDEAVGQLLDVLSRQRVDVEDLDAGADGAAAGPPAA
jgi:hypothetical protein